MSSSLKFKKVYVDTKFMTTDSNSTSDFKIELPETMYFDNNSSVFYIDDVCIPHSWYCITENFNDKLYLLIANENNTVSYPLIITLSKGNYAPTELATELQSKINDTVKAALSIASNSFTVSYTSKTNSMSIKLISNTIPFAGIGYYILTPADLTTKLGGKFNTTYNVTYPHDCNDIIGNLAGNSQFYTSDMTWQRGQVNLQPIRNIYIHSSALGNLSNIGPDGSQTVIKKIPVTADYNNYIFDQTVLYNDYNSCSGQTLKKIDFQFKTSKGEIIDLGGLNVSLSIVFSRAQPDA